MLTVSRHFPEQEAQLALMQIFVQWINESPEEFYSNESYELQGLHDWRVARVSEKYLIFFPVTWHTFFM